MRLTSCLLLAGLVLGSAACTGGDDTAEPAPTTTTTTSAAAPASTAPVSTDLSEGEHLAFITAIDVERRNLTVDVIQMREDEEGHPEIVNDNPRLRTLGVAAEAAVTFLATDKGGSIFNQPSSFDALPDHIATETTVRPSGFPHGPYSLRISGGQISTIDEMYLP